ncbi:hypothetical protein JZ751_022713 [Albula glossodonta]|uniref:Uroplakin-2 n=1 Tax=Albula glossodonta TaxID=121402 RepID=A0A8T2PDQ5_9TELE|nr:hypothetical protein JZ751_022713 [Albula glossodonta]
MQTMKTIILVAFGLFFTATNAETLTIEVPSCSESKRDLISVTEKNKNFILSKFLGYQVTNLTNGTEYRLTGILTSSYTQINDGLAARSGAMVVITVILSVAMFILVLGLIITVFFVNNGE